MRLSVAFHAAINRLDQPVVRQYTRYEVSNVWFNVVCVGDSQLATTERVLTGILLQQQLLQLAVINRAWYGPLLYCIDPAHSLGLVYGSTYQAGQLRSVYNSAAI